MWNTYCGLFPGSAAVPAAAGETPALPGNADFQAKIGVAALSIILSDFD
jgi:hypothetical protein